MDFERAVIHSPDRFEQNPFRCFGVSENAPFKLPGCSFVPAGRLGQIKQVTDVDEFVGFVVFDESDYGFECFS
jgi:hypothetical protein